MSGSDVKRSEPHPRRRLRRALRITLSVTAGLMLAGAVAMWLVTQSWFIIWRVRPELERRLGGAVEIGEAEYAGAGVFNVYDLKLHAPGIRGEGGDVLDCGMITVAVDQAKLLRGKVHVTNLELFEVRLRISEDAREWGKFSFMALQPEWSHGDGRLPSVRIHGADLEVGYHEDGDYVAVSERCVKGEMAPLLDKMGWMVFTLDETDQNQEVLADGIALTGQCNLAAGIFGLHVDGLVLDSRSYLMCPRIVRLWGNKMELEGRLSAVDVQWDARRGLSGNFEMEDVGLTLPVEAGILWARYQDGQIETHSRRPRMRVSSGSMRLTSKSLELRDLDGDIRGADYLATATPVPYTVSMTLDELPPLDWENKESWFDDVMKTVPFTVSVKLDDFLYGPDEDGRSRPVDLPLLVARFLERFALEEWRLTTSVDIERGPPTVDADGTLQSAKIVTSGRASIYDAKGAFERFPYLLEDLRGDLVFDEQQITVQGMTGRGSGDAIVSVDGIIAPPGPEARVDLTLTAQRIQLDERFRSALNDGQRRVLEALIHLPSAGSLQSAGLLPDADAVNAAAAELGLIEGRLESARPGDSSVEPLERRARQLRRLVAMGPFEAGGTVNLDLRLTRPAGADQRTTADGTIDIERAGLLFERFPYPMTITGGSVAWSDDGIEIADPGLPITTTGGGGGSVSGRIDFNRQGDELVIEPALVVDIREDAVSEAMIAAVPPSPEQIDELPEGAAWAGVITSRGGQLLRDLNLQAMLDYRGDITLLESGEVDFDLLATLSEGTIDVNEHLRPKIGGSNTLVDGSLAFDSIAGSVRVTKDALLLRSLTGRHELATVSATGRVGLGTEKPDMRLDLAVHDVAVDGRLLALLGADDPEGPIFELWKRYEPTGLLDAAIEYRNQGEGAETALHLMPRSVRFRIDGAPVLVTRSDGRLFIAEQTLHAIDLAFEIDRGDVSDGNIVLNGTWALNDDRRLELTAGWTGGLIESPLIDEAVRRAGALDSKLLDELQPRGSFDAEVELAHDAANGLDFDLFLRPGTLTFDRAGATVSSRFDAGSLVRVTPRAVEIIGLAGHLPGASYNLAGRLGLGPTFTATLEFDYTGSLRNPQFEAVLPPSTRGVLAKIEFQDDQPSRIVGGRADLERIRGDDGGWSSVVHADLVADDAAFNVGLKLSDIQGVFHLTTTREPGRPVDVDLRIEADQLVTYGQPIQNVRSRVTSTPSGDALIVNSFRGDLHGGAVSFEGQAGIGERRDYAFSLRAAGVSLEPTIRHAATADEAIGDAAADADGTTERSGEIFAGLDFSGMRGAEESRTGRGMIRILQGPVASVPAVLHAIQIMQLTMPMNSTIDYADIDFFVAGSNLQFEHLLFESSIGDISQLQLLGEGGLDLDTMELDVGFRIRSGVPIVREVVGGISDQLYRVRVKGPLGDPEASIEAFPAAVAPTAITMHESKKD